MQIQIRSSDCDRDDDHGKAAEINPKRRGNVQVAILSSSSFNAPAQVNVSSLTFGHSGTEKSLVYCEVFRRDVNHDRMQDLVCHFQVSKMNFQKDDKLGILNGKLRSGNIAIQGSAPVRIDH